MMAARRSYTAAFKLNVVAYAKEMGNRSAGNIFCVNEKQIRYWKKQEDLLRLCHKSKRANRGGSARWALLEDLLATWVLEQVATGRIRLCSKLIQQKAKTIARERNIQGFIGGPSWCFRFMRRKKLLFINGRANRNKIVGNMKPKEALDNNNDRVEEYDLSWTLSTGSQQSKSSTTTTKTALGPRELLLPNIETELPEQIEFASSQIENINEIKEEVQDDQPDCSVTMIVNESQLPDITHQEADSIIMDTCQPSSKRLLGVPEHQYRMMSSLASMWKEQRMCDASIGNGTTIIKVHKVVLLAISPTLLSSSEVRNDCFLRVNFPANISENAMRAFAEYMYNGVLDLDPLTLTQLQQISYQLGIEELCLLCETHLYSPTQDPDNIICPGTSLSHLATQSDTSSLQISLHHSSGPGVKNRHALTNSWGQSSQGQDFIRSGPAPIKTEPQDSVPVYGSRSSGFQTRSARIPNMAWSVSEATTHSRGFSSVAKASKTPKTFQEHSRALESPVISQIKMEPFDQKELEYSLHRPSLSSESSISNRLPTKSDRIRATTNCSDQSKLVSGTSPVIGTVSNLQQKFSKNQMKAVATPPISLSLSSGNKVVRPNHDDPSLRTIVGNNSFNSGLRSKHSTSDMPYPVMLFSSGEETVPINISQMEQYIDLTSS